ncbi:MAG TPA: hypothetical protein VGI05_08775 [Streptosporangiaceae bacterium]
MPLQPTAAAASTRRPTRPGAVVPRNLPPEPGRRFATRRPVPLPPASPREGTRPDQNGTGPRARRAIASQPDVRGETASPPGISPPHVTRVIVSRWAVSRLGVTGVIVSR